MPVIEQTTATLPAVLDCDIVAYHGTHADNLASIKEFGLRPSPRGALGPGAYLSRDPQIAAAWGARVALTAERIRMEPTFASMSEQLAWVDRHEADAWPVALIEVTVPAGLRGVALTTQPTGWGEFCALGDARSTLVGRYSSDAETQELGMLDLEPAVLERYARDEGLDVLDIVIDDPEANWLRSSQLLVTPRAAHHLIVTGSECMDAHCLW